MSRIYFKGGRCVLCGAYSEVLHSLCGWPGMLCEDCALEEGEALEGGELEDDDEDNDAPFDYFARGKDNPRA